MTSSQGAQDYETVNSGAVKEHNLPFTITATTDRKKALKAPDSASSPSSS